MRGSWKGWKAGLSPGLFRRTGGLDDWEGGRRRMDLGDGQQWRVAQTLAALCKRCNTTWLQAAAIAVPQAESNAKPGRLVQRLRQRADLGQSNPNKAAATSAPFAAAPIPPPPPPPPHPKWPDSATPAPNPQVAQGGCWGAAANGAPFGHEPGTSPAACNGARGCSKQGPEAACRAHQTLYQ